MFTGLVQCLGTIREIRAEPPGKHLVVQAPDVARDTALGDSIAVNGCCLSAVANVDGCLTFDVGPETLACTNLGALAESSRVNLEPSLRIGDRLGGHFVSGHVEGVGSLAARQDDREWSTFWFRFPQALGRYMVPKGSIAVDGVSLTLVAVEAEQFSVMLIPQTLHMTTLGGLAIGSRVNLETDLLAKYAQKQPVDMS